jgi:hypothetical protein
MLTEINASLDTDMPVDSFTFFMFDFLSVPTA